MERNQSIFEVQLSSSQATAVDLPREVLESCRRSLGAPKAALQSGAFERAVSGSVVADSNSASPAR